MCHSTDTSFVNLHDGYTHSVINPNIWKKNPDVQFPIIIENDSDHYFNIFWLIDPVPNTRESDHRLYKGGPNDWRIKHRNIMPGMKIIIPVGCIGHVFGLFQKCEDKSDIDLNRIIRIRDWNKGGKITFDGKRIYAVEKDKKITNLPLLTTTISPGFKSIS